MKMVLGQTIFQDTYFVVGDYERGPYRALRKLDMQVQEMRRTMPGAGDPRLEEAQSRLNNYAALREAIVASRPQEYWDAGFEAAEPEYWSNHLGRKVALETLFMGRPSVDTMTAVLSLPPDLRLAVIGAARAEGKVLREFSKPMLGIASE